MKKATLITGPVASGKSTIAQALMKRLEKHGQQCICVEMDESAAVNYNESGLRAKIAALELKTMNLLKREISEGTELILVAVNPELCEIRTLCCELGFTLVRHLTTEVFHGWPGYKLGVSQACTEREALHDEMAYLARKLENEFGQHALGLQDAFAQRVQDAVERFRRTTEKRMRELGR